MKKFQFIFAAFVALCVCICACSSDESEFDESGAIAGTISDKTTGEPVATVNIVLTPGGLSTVTGSDGSFAFNDLEPNDYVLSISKEGYLDGTSTVRVGHGQTAAAHLLIERMPGVVTADRELLDFGDNASTNTMSFNIVNRSYEDLNWTIEERCDWIVEIKPEAGVLKYGKTEGIVVVIDRDLLAPGENKSSIVIRSSNGSSQLSVSAIGVERGVAKLNTLAATNVTSSSAILNGEIISKGNPEYTERGFLYSTSPMPTVESTIKKITCPVNSNATYSYNLTGLELNTKYYVRAYAINSIGIAYSSNEISFTTVATLPTVKTLAIYNADISKGTATFRGEIVSAGSPAYTERGFVYSEMPNPTIYDEKIVANGAGVVSSYSKAVSNLPLSGYYVRAYAKSAGGVSYGEEQIVAPEWIEIPTAGIAVQCKDIGYGDWYSVKAMCENSTIGGFNDWRLPTKNELMTLYTNRDKIGGFTTGYYWSSTMSGNNYLTCVNFANGANFGYYYSNKSYGRAVRTLKK